MVWEPTLLWMWVNRICTDNSVFHFSNNFIYSAYDTVPYSSEIKPHISASFAYHIGYICALIYPLTIYIYIFSRANRCQTWHLDILMKVCTDILWIVTHSFHCNIIGVHYRVHFCCPDQISTIPCVLTMVHKSCIGTWRTMNAVIQFTGYQSVAISKYG